LISGEFERRFWTEEAVEALSHRPEAVPAPMTTETAAWRAGYVAGWVDLRAKLAGEASSVVPSER
jgi:hypothetical protein